MIDFVHCVRALLVRNCLRTAISFSIFSVFPTRFTITVDLVSYFNVSLEPFFVFNGVLKFQQTDFVFCIGITIVPECQNALHGDKHLNTDSFSFKGLNGNVRTF